MKLHHVLFIAACFVLPATDAWAQPKNSAGTPCISSGSERHVGKGSDGKKCDCMMDYCPTCGVTSGVIGCSSKVTEWSNATYFKPVAKIVCGRGGGGGGRGGGGRGGGGGAPGH